MFDKTFVINYVTDSPKDDLEENKKENLVQLLQRSHQCPHCESLFTRKDNLISHIASVHERKKPYQCTDCNQSYAKKDNLKVHVAAIHEGKKLNKCPDCEASFAQKTQMLNHINSVHEGIKSFECTTCKGMVISEGIFHLVPSTNKCEEITSLNFALLEHLKFGAFGPAQFFMLNFGKVEKS